MTPKPIFLRFNGNAFRVSDSKALDMSETLPPGNFLIQQTPAGELYFQQIDSFQPIKKTYGKHTNRRERILSTFAARPASTGVMLTGEKGSGKTLLARELSIEAEKMGMPTILINAPWRGDAFNNLLQSVHQPTLVLFDEFEKVYDEDEQTQILSLLDGVWQSKKLFILTCNDKWRVDRHMRNRPGRIFYMYDFQGLDADFVREYCEDVLVDKSHISAIIGMLSMFREFNFDMLKCLVEDMNRYNESPQQVIEHLNARPENNTDLRFDITLVINGEVQNKDLYEPTYWGGAPIFTTRHEIRHKVPKQKRTKGDDIEYTTVTYAFEPQHLRKMEEGYKSFTYVNNDGITLIFKLRERTEADFRSYNWAGF